MKKSLLHITLFNLFAIVSCAPHRPTPAYSLIGPSHIDHQGIGKSSIYTSISERSTSFSKDLETSMGYTLNIDSLSQVSLSLGNLDYTSLSNSDLDSSQFGIYRKFNTAGGFATAQIRKNFFPFKLKRFPADSNSLPFFKVQWTSGLSYSYYPDLMHVLSLGTQLNYQDWDRWVSPGFTAQCHLNLPFNQKSYDMLQSMEPNIIHYLWGYPDISPHRTTMINQQTLWLGGKINSLLPFGNIHKGLQLGLSYEFGISFILNQDYYFHSSDNPYSTYNPMNLGQVQVHEKAKIGWLSFHGLQLYTLYLF